VRSAVHSRTNRDLGLAVAGQVRGRHGDAAAEVVVVGEEVGDRVGVHTTEYAHPWAAALAGRGDHVRRAIPVHVGRRDVDATEETRREDEHAADGTGHL